MLLSPHKGATVLIPEQYSRDIKFIINEESGILVPWVGFFSKNNKWGNVYSGLESKLLRLMAILTDS